MDEDERNEVDEPDFLDVMDAWDEIDPYEDEEKFVPFFAGDKVRIIAMFLAAAMFSAAAYGGIRILLRWLGI